jgi:hypothetical protein
VKTILISAVTAAIVCALAFWLDETFDDDDAAATARSATGASPDAEATTARNMPGPAANTSAPETAVIAEPVLSLADALLEDVWVNAARQPGSDRRTLTSAADSVCYLTKVEIAGIQGPEDRSSCAIEVDDFTGFWQLVATAEEGGRSEIRCNARCVSLAPKGE